MNSESDFSNSQEKFVKIFLTILAMVTIAALAPPLWSTINYKVHLEDGSRARLKSHVLENRDLKEGQRVLLVLADAPSNGRMYAWELSTDTSFIMDPDITCKGSLPSSRRKGAIYFHNESIYCYGIITKVGKKPLSDLMYSISLF